MEGFGVVVVGSSDVNVDSGVVVGSVDAVVGSVVVVVGSGDVVVGSAVVVVGSDVVVVSSGVGVVGSAVVVLGSELEAVEGPFDIIFKQSIFKEQIKLIAEQSTKAYCKCMLIFEKYQTLIICFLVH